MNPILAEFLFLDDTLYDMRAANATGKRSPLSRAGLI
jgi:hypothetical protein